MPAGGNERIAALRVKEIASSTPFTSTPGEWLTRLYSLPRKLQDIRVLDVAAGCSDFVNWLGERGATAVALDYNYAGTAAIRERWEAWMREAAQQRLGGGGRAAIEAMEAASARFEGMRRNGAAAYVRGSAHALPFSDGQFDFVTSFSGIFGALDQDLELLGTAVEEAIRVTGRRGQVQLAPALSGSWLSRAEIRAQRTLVERLKTDRRLKVKLTHHHDEATGEFGRLTIEKRA